MAGSGQRFVDVGYKDPKPLIKVRGKRIIEYVCDMFDRENDNFTFICNTDHLRKSDMITILKNIVKKCKITPILPHKLGPVYTFIIANPPIVKEEPIIIAHCDTPLIWDYNGFRDFVQDKDGCIVSCKGFHPHSLSSTLWAHSKTDENNRIWEIKEKACYTDNHFEEHASAGIYYFRYGAYVLKYFRQLIDSGDSFNGEFYVTLVFNLLIKDGLSVYSYLSDYILSFGTPDDVRNFEAWQTIIDGAQVKDRESLEWCYEYWKKYRSKC